MTISDSEPELTARGESGHRMHLNREDVAALVAHLQRWLETGGFSE